MKKRRRLKKSVIKFFIITLIIIILSIFGYCKIKEINSYPYKLSKLGYTKNDITLITKLNDNQIEKILKKKYNKLIPKFLKQKYFIFDNLDSYIKYYIDNNDTTIKDTVSIINVKVNYDYYDKKATNKTDVSKNNLMLVNKFNYLDEKYVPSDLVDVKNYYSYGENQIKKEVYENFLDMWNDAKSEDLSIIITSSYRDYNYQKQLWDSYSNQKGESWADSVAARAGYSEHQTGLSIDVFTYGSTMDSFEGTDEFKWLQKNSYKYGFILRYPKGKENLTGYDYEPWHYRYVGKEVAKQIYEEKITFDEYYAYYIKNKGK